MANEKKAEFEIVEINETMIQSKIYLVRDQKVMLDFELAEIYGQRYKRLKCIPIIPLTEANRKGIMGITECGRCC